jgi:DNA-binding transcriptional regulator YiaG
MIYFARCGHDGPIKIGHTIGGISSRISYLQVGCPWPITVLGTMDGDFFVEADLLRKFAHLNMRGEWFHAADELLAFIEENSSPSERKPVVRTPVKLFSVNSIDDEDWPAIIARIMDVNGWKQCDMAEALCVHQAMISKWKSGLHGPSKPARILMRAMLAKTGTTSEEVTAADLVAVSERAKRQKAEKAEQERPQA